MSEIDLERLGGVWRQQPDPAELERLRRTAAAVSRRARLAQVVDLGAAVLLSAVVILLALYNPTIDSVIMGTAAILVLLISNIRLRRLRQVESRSLTGTTEEMLNQSIERIETTIKYHRFTLIAMWPGLLIAALFAASVEGRVGALLEYLNGAPLFRLIWQGVWVTALAGVVLFLIFSIRRNRRQLERLRAMRDAYRRERESTTT